MVYTWIVNQRDCERGGNKKETDSANASEKIFLIIWNIQINNKNTKMFFFVNLFT